MIHGSEELYTISTIVGEYPRQFCVLLQEQQYAPSLAVRIPTTTCWIQYQPLTRTLRGLLFHPTEPSVWHALYVPTVDIPPSIIYDRMEFEFDRFILAPERHTGGDQFVLWRTIHVAYRSATNARTLLWARVAVADAVFEVFFLAEEITADDDREEERMVQRTSVIPALIRTADTSRALIPYLGWAHRQDHVILLSLSTPLLTLIIKYLDPVSFTRLLQLNHRARWDLHSLMKQRMVGKRWQWSPGLIGQFLFPERAVTADSVSTATIIEARDVDMIGVEIADLQPEVEVRFVVQLFNIVSLFWERIVYQIHYDRTTYTLTLIIFDPIVIHRIVHTFYGTIYIPLTVESDRGYYHFERFELRPDEYPEIQPPVYFFPSAMYVVYGNVLRPDDYVVGEIGIDTSDDRPPYRMTFKLLEQIMDGNVQQIID